MTKKKEADAEFDIIEHLLSLEAPARQAAYDQPDGPNVDAVKHALVQIAQRIGALANALDTNRRVAR